MRIAVAGFQHETNTFAQSKANDEAFIDLGSWPRLCEKAALLSVFNDQNIPMAGFLKVARRQQADLVPILWAAAEPSGYVAEQTFEGIVASICLEIQFQHEKDPLDAIYLDCHGALVAEHIEDGEGELLRRIRSVVGDDVPIVMSLDFHANVTEAMVRLTNYIDGYRTYPHTDMADTGARVAEVLFSSYTQLKKGFSCFYHQFDFLTSLPWQTTDLEPGKRLFAMLQDLVKTKDIYLAFFPGFPLADIHDAGVTLVGYAKDETEGRKAFETMQAAIQAAEPDFSGRCYLADEAVAYAKAQQTDKAIILADVQDNPGGGGSGDSVGLLKALITHKAQRALFGLLCDPIAAKAAHDAGIGACLHLRLGAYTHWQDEQPIAVDCEVVALSDGHFDCHGPYYAGCSMSLGLCALLKVDDVLIAISTKKVQAADQALFTHLGVDLTQIKILGLKSSAHFRAHFTTLANDIIIVASPGASMAQLEAIPYQHIREQIRNKYHA